MQIIERTFRNMLKEIFTNLLKRIQFCTKKEQNKQTKLTQLIK